MDVLCNTERQRKNGVRAISILNGEYDMKHIERKTNAVGWAW